MIKLNKVSGKNQRFYLLARTNSVSPDYLGLLATFGTGTSKGTTVCYWFRNQITASGREIPARLLLLRKVRELVLRRLRNGYQLTRRCDRWCRVAIEKSVAAGQLPKKARPRRAKPPEEPNWQKDQLAFDFQALAKLPPMSPKKAVIKSRVAPQQLSFDFAM